MTTRNPFSGYQINVTVRAWSSPTRAQSEAIKAGLGAGEGQGLQGNCAVAEAVGRAFGGRYVDRNRGERILIPGDGIDFGGMTYRLNPKAHPRFGYSAATCRLAITVPLIAQDAELEQDKTRWRLTWHDRAIPRVLAEKANAHDDGQDYSEVTVALDMDDATVTWQKYVADQRPKGAEANLRKNHAHGSRILVEVTEEANSGVVTARVRDRGTEARAKKTKRAAAAPQVQPSGGLTAAASKATRRNSPQTSTVTRKHLRPSCADLDAIYAEVDA